MKCIENISLEIKVFKSLFIQIIDGLNFGHIYDDYVAIWKCLSQSRRIFRKPSIFPCFQGEQSGISHQSSPREFVCVCVCGGGGGVKNLPWRIFLTALFVTASFFSFLTSWQGNKAGGGNKKYYSLMGDNVTFIST